MAADTQPVWAPLAFAWQSCPPIFTPPAETITARSTRVNGGAIHRLRAPAPAISAISATASPVPFIFQLPTIRAGMRVSGAKLMQGCGEVVPALVARAARRYKHPVSVATEFR